MAEIYFIGGSPCSGKSTTAQRLAEKYDLLYFKVDEKLDEYIQRGSQLNLEICTKQSKMNTNQIFMREPSLQCREELQFYEETFAFALSDLKAACNEGRDIITEGAAFLPNLMKETGVVYHHYLSIVPTRDFQISHYAQREWLHFVLNECQDGKKAFDHWMERDCQFAEEVNRRCKENGYRCIINDGETDIEVMTKMVEKHFELSERSEQK